MKTVLLGIALVGAALASLAGCQGVQGDACRSNRDCGEPGDECLNRDAPGMCGVPPQELCNSDADCGEGRCHAISDYCSRDGVGSQCAPPCSNDAGCDNGFRCNAAGACEAVSCADGVACPDWQVCNPAAVASVEAVHERHHGCVIVSCSNDEACPDALVCVNGYCQTGLGGCGEPMLVP